MLNTSSFQMPGAELQRLETSFPERVVGLGDGSRGAVRECGNGPVLMCLHGIGSGAASWLEVALPLAGEARVIAWDAPGYGGSTALESRAPRATDYADRLTLLLDALQVERCVLVAHSLGALIACAAAREGSAMARRITRLVLMSPASGYGAPGKTERAASVRSGRLDSLVRLGIEGMASERSSRLLSENASAQQRAWVRWNMARLNEAGYRQAVELLCGDDIFSYLPPVAPVRVLCGGRDVVTPPAACAEVAAACAVPLELVRQAGHACYVEQPEEIAAVLRSELAAVQQRDMKGREA